MPNARRDTRTALRTAPRERTEQAMGTLYRQWYAALVAGLRLDPATFQLLQPSSALGDATDQLWAQYNPIPPAALLNNLRQNPVNRLYDNYRAVVNLLVSRTADLFREDVGDCYPSWTSYVSRLAPTPRPADLPEVFFSWATIHCPGPASRGRDDLQGMLADPIAVAQQAVLDRSGFVNGVPDFTATIQDLRDALGQAPSATLHWDSALPRADDPGGWAGSEVGRHWDFFADAAGGEPSGDWAEIQAKAAASPVTVSAAFQHALSFRARPGAWYRPAALRAAFATPGDTVWKRGAGADWTSTFGPNGSMRRMVRELVVVDGINATMTSAGGYRGGEEQAIRSAAAAGVFPFFFAETAAGVTSAVSFDGEGTMTVSWTCPPGNPVVLGAVVAPVEEWLAER